MGKYLDRKQAIEQKLKDEITNAAAALAASIDAAAVYTEKERHRVMHEAVDRYNARTAGPRKTAVAQESRLFEELGQAVEAAIATPPSAEALRYLDALALNPSVTAHDIEAAASFVRGNAAAEASLAGHRREERPRSGRGVRCGPFHPRDFGRTGDVPGQQGGANHEAGGSRRRLQSRRVGP